jgi:hypothetical protein
MLKATVFTPPFWHCYHSDDATFSAFPSPVFQPAMIAECCSNDKSAGHETNTILSLLVIDTLSGY